MEAEINTQIDRSELAFQLSKYMDNHCVDIFKNELKIEIAKIIKNHAENKIQQDPPQNK